MELSKDIKDEIWEYCRVNDISGIDAFIVKMVKQGFTSEKFGSTPWEKEPEIKEVIKEVEVEKIVEVVKEVEVIKEVQVEVIKEVKVTDDTELENLIDEINDLKEEVYQKEQRINSLNVQAMEVNDLYKDLDTRKNEVSGLNLKVGRLESRNLKLDEELDGIKTELDEVRRELSEEQKKPKQKEDDIYGETKKGFFGSNVSDIWKKK